MPLPFTDELSDLTCGASLNSYTIPSSQMVPTTLIVRVLVRFQSVLKPHRSAMIASLDNFISFGGDTFASQPEYLDRLLDIFESAMTSTQLGATDRMHACKLAESVMLNIRGRSDRAIPVFLNRAVELMTRKNVNEEPIITSALYLHALELIINALFYNPQLTIAFLDSRSATGFFFNKWAAKVDKFNRVHDCKLGIMAISTILSELDRLPDAMKEASASLIHVALRLFAVLPKAFAGAFSSCVLVLRETKSFLTRKQFDESSKMNITRMTSLKQKRRWRTTMHPPRRQTAMVRFPFHSPNKTHVLSSGRRSRLYEGRIRLL
jgi:hypothetical protein